MVVYAYIIYGLAVAALLLVLSFGIWRVTRPDVARSFTVYWLTLAAFMTPLLVALLLHTGSKLP